jgi:hypothetical protein
VVRVSRAGDFIAATGVTRVEVIDHRMETMAVGTARAFSAWDVAVTVSVQDDGRTLKIFVKDQTDDDGLAVRRRC